MSVPTNGIERLYHFVTERRHALGINRNELFRRGGPAPSTLNKALAGDRGVTRDTLDRLEYALGWARGSAAAVYAGGLPGLRTLNTDPGDGDCPDHDHVLTVLKTVRSNLNSSEQLLADLLGPDHVS